MKNTEFTCKSFSIFIIIKRPDCAGFGYGYNRSIYLSCPPIFRKGIASTIGRNINNWTDNFYFKIMRITIYPNFVSCPVVGVLSTFKNIERLGISITR